jgi:hypothetical protein
MKTQNLSTERFKLLPNGRGYISVREYVKSSYQATLNYPARTELE